MIFFRLVYLKTRADAVVIGDRNDRLKAGAFDLPALDIVNRPARQRGRPIGRREVDPTALPVFVFDLFLFPKV